MKPSDNEPDITAATAQAEAAASPEPVAKTRRRRSAPAVVAGDDTGSAPAVAEAGEAAPAAAAPPKPRRPRRQAETAADGADAPPAALAPAPLAQDPPESRAEPVATAVALPPPADGDTTAAGEFAPGDERRRRNRNRRRGRRGGSEAGEGGDGAVVVTVTTSPDDDDDEAGAGDGAEVASLPAPVDAGETFASVITGEFDAEPAVSEPGRRVLAAEPDSPKLHKVLAQAGIGSRRDMEDLITAGQVQVNGQVAHTGQRVSFGDRIAVGGRLLKVRIVPPAARVIAYHKPVGEVVTRDDPQQRPTVFRHLPRLPQGKWQSVGRLDINTEGLLLFTNSGELANQLMHPRFGVEREYAVRVIGRLDDDARARLLEGVDIEGQRAAFRSIVDGGGEGVNHWYRAVIAEGRNREVRKLFDKVGHGVSRLIRIRYGCVVLPRGLKRGVWVDLNSAEVQQLRRLAAPGARSDHVAAEPRPDSKRNRRNNKRGGEARDPRDPRDRGPQGGPPPARPRNPDADEIDFGAIPNPLQQTFDKRAIREARQPKREIAEDGPIPNPLEQTYDRRFVQKPRGPGRAQDSGAGGPGGQPDPMKTSQGYIGADAFVRKFQGGTGGRWGGKRGGGGRR